MEMLQGYIDKLSSLNFKEMYENDFFLTRKKTDEELETVWAVADTFRFMGKNNISTKVFESGLGISSFRDSSTRTRLSFTSACNLLDLKARDLDKGRNQTAHSETVRETVSMISFMANVISTRNDIYTDKGNTYMHEVADAIIRGHKDGVLGQKPTLVDLQCDIDHPTQCMVDTLYIIHEFGGVESLKGKELAMTWAYSPSYDKPLSVPQGIVGLMTRVGMEAVLAHPEGYEIMPEVEGAAKKGAEKTGGSSRVSHDIANAFEGADVVYPKSQALSAAMEKRTNLYAEGDHEGTKALEKEPLAQNAEYKDWCCTKELMKTTKDGRALYLCCLPVGINDVSCKDGEAEATVFDCYRDPLYKEANCKPYVIVAMIILVKFADPADILKRLEEKGTPRVFR